MYLEVDRIAGSQEEIKMARSHFGRFKEGVQISGINLNVHQKGKVFYVGNSTVPAPNGIGASNNNPGISPDAPFSTLDYAIGRCVASRGDKIIVLPGHAETISGAAGVAIDVAGVSIIGTGDGALKPTFSFSATVSTMTMSAANCSLKGIRLVATIDSVVAGLIISGANCEVDIETADTSAAIEFAIAIQTTATADNVKIKARHRGFVAGNAMTRYIDLVGCRDAVIDVDFFGIASTSVVDMRTTACDNVAVTGRFYNESAALTKNVTNNTTSTWSVRGFDAKGGYDFAGSDDSAVAVVSTATSTALGTDGTTVTDSATTVLGAVGANNANNAFSSTSVVANQDGSVLERLEALMDPLGAYDPVLGFRVTKTSNLADGAGTDNLFTVTGRCLVTMLTGEVTTVIGGAATMKLRDVTNSVDLCAATTIDTDAVGTMYALTSISTNILNGTGATPVVGSIPNITGASSLCNLVIGDVQAALTIAHVLDAADTGNVAWVLYYKPLTAASSIVAAA